VTGTFGAEITGADLRRGFDDESYARMRRAYNESGVIFLRDQHLDPAQFVAFGARFGPLTKSKLYPWKVAGHDELQEIRKEEGADKNFGGNWHADQSFRAHPIMGTGLIARKVPAAGGDTAFINMAAAFDGLSDGLKQTVRGLRAVHTDAHLPTQIKRRAELNRDRAPGDEVQPDEAIHPVVGRHPETHRSVLYINPFYTVRFEGWTQAESAPLLRTLFEHALRPEYFLRWRWEVGSIALWDNRQVLHYAVNDYPGGERVLHRLMVEGPFLQG
jgi:taurine dioxygenase